MVINEKYNLVHFSRLLTILFSVTNHSKFLAYWFAGIPYGDAVWDVANLQRIAMERCKTARCAIELMGKLATEDGYYGSNDPPETGAGMYEESGEALTIIDPEESWVFHILPDNTGKSAIWAAQRLQPDHFAVVANKFIIRKFDFNDKENFLGTPNMREIAVEAGFWPKNRTDFDFALAFAPDAGSAPGWADRRTWHLFNWVAPALKLSPTGPEEYPFSVKVEKKLSVHDIMAMNRDHFEGTEFDLAHNAAAGPYNNPNRYDRNRKPEYAGGYFERAISLHRTSYSFVAQARSWLPAPIGGILWFAHHAPHSSLFVPLYSSTKDLPKSWKTGTLYQLRRGNAWWAFAAVANFAEKMFMFIQRDVNKRQMRLEHEAVRECHERDNQALEALKQSSAENYDKAVQIMTDYTVKNAELQVNDWWEFLDYLFTKYRDGTVLQSFEPPLRAVGEFYPAWWLGRVGYYDRGPLPPYMPPMTEPQPPPHPEFLPKEGGQSFDTKALKRLGSMGHAALNFRAFVTEDELAATQALHLYNDNRAISKDEAVKSSQLASVESFAFQTAALSFGQWLAFILCLLIVGAASFYAGSVYNQRSSNYYEYSSI
jgi:dipeptidase